MQKELCTMVIDKNDFIHEIHNNIPCLYNLIGNINLLLYCKLEDKRAPLTINFTYINKKRS